MAIIRWRKIPGGEVGDFDRPLMFCTAKVLGSRQSAWRNKRKLPSARSAPRFICFALPDGELRTTAPLSVAFLVVTSVLPPSTTQPDQPMAPPGPIETQPAEPRGLVCRVCGCQHFYVTHTEPLPGGKIRRRRVCRHCGAKYVTYEWLYKI